MTYSSTNSDYLIYTDGGSINNKHAACAFIITDSSSNVLYVSSVYLGPLTNNCAECNAIIYALISSIAKEMTSYVTVYSDSQLTINQINGIYQIKAPHLIPYHKTIKYLSTSFKSINFKWVPRETPLISTCDRLCDRILNNCHDGGIDA